MLVNLFLLEVLYLSERREVNALYASILLTVVGLCISIGISKTQALDWMLSAISPSTDKGYQTITTLKKGYAVYDAKERRKLNVWNSGLPKARNCNGNGFAIVVNLQVGARKVHTEVRKSKGSLKSEAGNGQGSLGEKLTYNTEGKCNNAYQVLSQNIVLQTAYMRIKSEPGNMTPGPDKETLDGIDEP